MPADTTLATKRRNTNTTAPTTSPDHDHRKRRRNRTTQSCLNCHTTKRMCDRKRPCSRCTQLGLTGLCVYEVHDPARQSTASDESSRLLNRITELEGVVRDLKNKPHPRWADSREMPLPHSPPGVPTSSPMSSPHGDPSLLGLSSLGDISWADLLHWDSPRSSDSAYSHSPISTPSPLVMSGFRPPEPSPPVVRHDCHGNAHLARKVNSGCDCLREPACYNMAVELGSQLRRVATVMNRSLGHCFGTPCPLNTKISELEALTRSAIRILHTNLNTMLNSE
ncbi:hypothetical protein B0H11DRAFT_109624 [Mycena galericulata]|nr:hypothetical protein B0H11DRAFT_109624 [Mycena galericulata]